MLGKLVARAGHGDRARRRADHGRSSRTRPATARRSAASRSSTDNGWFAARPSGTENVYKIYAESFRGEDAPRQRIEEAQAIVKSALDGAA